MTREFRRLVLKEIRTVLMGPVTLEHYCALIYFKKAIERRERGW